MVSHGNVKEADEKMSKTFKLERHQFPTVAGNNFHVGPVCFSLMGLDTGVTIGVSLHIIRSTFFNCTPRASWACSELYVA
jgi:hypothetical protein